MLSGPPPLPTVYSPLNTVLTVRKYEPMGTTIMANVKASSFAITSLGKGRRGPCLSVNGMPGQMGVSSCDPHGESVREKNGVGGGGAYMGTAGAMLDFVPAAGLAPTMSSFSRMVFSPEMILWVAMLLTWGGGVKNE